MISDAPSKSTPVRDWSLRAFVENQDAPRHTAFDLVVGTGFVLAAVLARLALEQIVGGVVPFLLTFPAVIGATLLAGKRAGVLAGIGCQVLTFWFVFPHWLAGRGGASTDLVNLLLSSLSIAGTIWAASSYRHVSGQLRQQCSREVETLSLLIREMDHRTKNNFQIAAHLLGSQGRAAENSLVAHELDTASSRLMAISSVYSNLLVGTRGEDQISLREYLRDLIAHLRLGWLEDGLDIDLQSDEIRLASSRAIIVGLVVNEWITNAVKHAFPDRRGSIRVTAETQGGSLIVTVADNGQATGNVSQTRTGSRLMHGLANAIGGVVEVAWQDGTRCRLCVPLPKDAGIGARQGEHQRTAG